MQLVVIVGGLALFYTGLLMLIKFLDCVNQAEWDNYRKWKGENPTSSQTGWTGHMFKEERKEKTDGNG